MRRQARSTAWAVSLFACLAATSSQAADLIWEVESPFRFFKASRSFALHEAAFNVARGDPSAPLPTDIVWRTAEAHAIVADHVVRHVRTILGRQDAPQDVLESRVQ
jgi:hypothetical protein